MSFHRRLIFVMLVVVAGCSRTELLYRNADWLALRWAGALVDASDVQNDAWREPFKRAMAQHRDEILPDLVVLLRLLEGEFGQGLQADRLQCLVEAADGLYRDHARLAVRLGARVLRDLSPEQIAHLAGELQERNRDYREDYLDADPAQREHERVARYVERIERWTGDLSTEQVRAVENAVRGMPDLAGAWLTYRVQQQTQLLTLLRGAADRESLQRFLADWWVDLADRPPELERKTGQVRTGSIEMVVALHAMLTAEQRQELLENVQQLREDLEGAAGARAQVRPTHWPAADCPEPGRPM